MSELRDKIKEVIMQSQLFSDYRGFVQHYRDYEITERMKLYNGILDSLAKDLEMLMKTGGF
jgi:hypothetical protein